MTQAPDRDNVRKIARDVYMVLMGILFIWYLHLLFTYSTKATPVYIQVFRMITVGLAVWLGQLWKERAWRLLMVFWLMIFLRLLIPTPEMLSQKDPPEMLLLGLWLYSACFGLGKALPEKQMKRFLTVSAAIWLAAMVIYSAVGIYAAWTGETVHGLLGKSSWRIAMTSRGYSLKMLFGKNQAGAILCFSGLIALILFWCTNRKTVRVLLFLALAVMLLPMCLTGSRTAMITFSLGAGGMAGILIVRLATRKTTWRPFLCWGSGGAAAAAVLLCVFLLLSHVVPLFNQVKANGLISAAGAEAGTETAEAAEMTEAAETDETAEGTETAETAAITEAAEAAESPTEAEEAPAEVAEAPAEEEEPEPEITERDLGDLSGRDRLWQHILIYLGDEPQFLLYGASIIDPLKLLNELYAQTNNEQVHCHNTLLQVLAEAGVPGFLLILAFAIIVGARGIRLVKNGREGPRWLCLIPMVMFAVWAGEMAECFLILLRYRTPMQPIGFVVMGIVYYYGKKTDCPQGQPERKALS